VCGRSLSSHVSFISNASLEFYSKKLYQGPFEREGLAEEINGGIYRNWEPHWMFVGEIIDVREV